MRPVVFLDIDDVIATGDVWMSSWVIRSFRPGGQEFTEEEWRGVFSAEACGYLKLLHERFSPTYVISSSWSNYLTKSDMQSVLEKTGLAFVSTCLHEDWTTPKSISSNRHAEISAWLADHPDVTIYLILDDLNSGYALHGSNLHERTIFCTSAEGLNSECLLEAERILSHPNESNAD